MKRPSNLTKQLAPLAFIVVAANCQQADVEDEFPPTIASEGTYSIEAETVDTATPWETLESTIRVKRSVARNDDANAQPNNSTVGIVTFDFSSVAANKRFYFWANYRALNSGDDSVYVAARSGIGNFSFKRTSVPITNANFGWQKLAVEVMSGSGGSVSLALKNRESGFEVDRVVATINPEFDPEASEPPPPPPPTGDDDVREYAAIGTKSWKRLVFDRPLRGWATTEWNKLMAGAYEDMPCAFNDHYPAIAARVKWSDTYINGNIKPTRAQARNPNWSNYVWNRSENQNNDFVYDGITDALNSSFIDNGDGVAKLQVLLSLTSTSGSYNPPEWMRADSSLTWEEPKNQNGSLGNWHVRFDNQPAVDHAADFLTAFLAKYGNNRGIHSIRLGEYYLGPRNTRPSNLSVSAYLRGMRDLWFHSSETAPRDANGQRVDIIQTNALFGSGSGVSLDDLEASGLGIAESDTRLDLPVNGSPSEPMLDAVNRGMHFMIGGDARYACQGRRQGWDGTANPFGHKSGYSGVATPQELLWYHGESGPIPAQSFFMSLAQYCKDSPQTYANILDGLARFGRCGRQATQWGPSPAAF